MLTLESGIWRLLLYRSCPVSLQNNSKGNHQALSAPNSLFYPAWHYQIHYAISHSRKLTMCVHLSMELYANGYGKPDQFGHERSDAS